MTAMVHRASSAAYSVKKWQSAATHYTADPIYLCLPYVEPYGGAETPKIFLTIFENAAPHAVPRPCLIKMNENYTRLQYIVSNNSNIVLSNSISPLMRLSNT